LASRELGVVEENGAARDAAEISDERLEGLVALGRALSDPIRVRMLAMMAGGRSCCDLPDLGVPVGEPKVSYHVRKLKDAGLVREEKRGRWSFYSLDREAAEGLLGDVEKHLRLA
jgi:ArsR family transcriptional regulator